MSETVTDTRPSASGDGVGAGAAAVGERPAAPSPALDPDPTAVAVAGEDTAAAAPAPATVAERAAGLDLAGFDEIEEAMRDVVDPELGINVVDLGLVYGIHVADDNSVTLDMTLTSAACPLTDVIEDQTRSALVDGPDGLVSGVTINWVWMPPWGPDKITDDGREQLRALGFNV